MKNILKKLVLLGIKLGVTIASILALTTIFMDCIFYEVMRTLPTDNVTFIGMVLSVVLLLFYRPLRKAVFGNEFITFLKFLGKVYLMVGIWYFLNFGLGAVLVIAFNYFGLDIVVPEIIRIESIISMVICFMIYRFFSNLSIRKVQSVTEVFENEQQYQTN